jgi:L-seryl-tRNA(Ser) seleniumtransferase
VAYSGGKCLRGPQAAGLLLGRKDLVKAAWVHSAPHHGPGRGYKVGKEEAIGMLMAVEMWMKRDHEAEWKQWTSWLEHVAKRVSAIDGITTTIVQPRGLSNRMPSLRILWNRDRLGLAGDAVVRTLWDTDPRIGLFPARGEGDPAQTGVTVNPYMMMPGDDKVVAERLHAVLSSPPAKAATDPPRAPAADLSGRWDVKIEYAAGTSRHALNLRQRGNEVDGMHTGDFVSRDLSGTIDGDKVRLRSAFGEETGDSISYTFSGQVTDEEMSGTVDMGEYLGARFTASRRVRGRG